MSAADSDEQDTHDMEGLAGGHEAALDPLMERHAERLFHFMLRSLQDESDAADLVQETFVRVFQNRTKFDSRQRFSTWLYAIATNLVRDRFRWRSRHPQVSLELESETTGLGLRETLAETKPSPSAVAENNERAEAVRQAVARLPEELRLPLILAEYEEHSHAEIGEILGCSAKAVETRIYRARQQLRVTLGKWLKSS